LRTISLSRMSMTPFGKPAFHPPFPALLIVS
jgi:hypothetical protein